MKPKQRCAAGAALMTPDVVRAHVFANAARRPSQLWQSFLRTPHRQNELVGAQKGQPVAEG
jgi:hypothetical protein